MHTVNEDFMRNDDHGSGERSKGPERITGSFARRSRTHPHRPRRPTRARRPVSQRAPRARALRLAHLDWFGTAAPAAEWTWSFGVGRYSGWFEFGIP